jgi:hypothetical protein
MDFKMQNGQAQTPQRPAATGGSFSAVPGGPAGARKLIAIVVGVLVIVALVIGALLFSKSGSSTATSAKVDTGKYQAIFLTNGQVYFGKLSDVNSGYVNIKDVYYLQVQQAVQPATNNTEEQPKVSLTKLGNELHGPTDEMHISRDQVLFWENLKTDSTVVKAIDDYKNKQ